MALKPCKECGKEISTEAKACPNCGKKNPTTAATPRWAWAVVVIGIIVAIGLASSNSSPPAPALTPADSARQKASLASARAATRRQDSIAHQLDLAENICHFAAEKTLKAPATAKFVDAETYRKDLGKSRTHIQLQIDAENSFSAMIRTTFDCKTKQTGGNVSLTSIDSWTR